MTKKEISTILTESGVDGLEKEIKSHNRQTFKEIVILGICLVLINIFIITKQNESNRIEIQQFKCDYAIKVGTKYGIAIDSLVKIAESNGIENCLK
jgi:hypothetical protein